LKDQLLLLLDVQRHDVRIKELDGMLQALPQKLDGMRADLKKVEALLARERAQLAEVESWRTQQLDAAKDEEARLVAAKQRSGAVKNVKEMMASERELQASRLRSQERAAEIAKLEAAVDSARKSITQHEADVEALRQVVVREEQGQQSKAAELTSQLEAARGERATLAARVDPEAMKRYASIRVKRGLALVAVKRGTCQGCNMNIPPQVFNRLQRGDSLENCDHCYRLLYWDQLLVQSSDGEPADKAAERG
jgi:predicted  nucleic acid-binding Zn-ribbon protein